MLTPIPGNGVNSTELPSLSWGLDGAQRKTQRHGGGGGGRAVPRKEGMNLVDRTKARAIYRVLTIL